MTALNQQVLVLDDDASVCVSLSHLLNANGFKVLAYTSAEELLRAGISQESACLLLDQHLGSVKGTDVQAELLLRGWSIPTIFLTADWDAHTVVQAMRGGADNYLTKPYDPDELIKVVCEVCKRGHTAAVQNDGIAELRRRATLLTPRERAIVSMVTKGMMNKQIAHHFQLALVTVKLDRARAMRKLGAHNSAELAHIALRVGI